jgi:hypothetical protein
MFVEHIKEIHVEPTTVCQAECVMCARTVLNYHSTNKSLNTELTLNKFQELTKNLIGNLEKILFCGTLGDPASCVELLDIIKWAQEKNPNLVIGINTNGAIRNTQWWKELAYYTNKNIYSYVVFSIDGLEDTNHIYRKNVKWKKLIENVQSYIAAGGVAQWDMLVFDHNKHQVDEARELARTMMFRAFRTKVSSRFSQHKTDLLPPDNHIDLPEPDIFECMAERTKSVYLSANGLWFPCCYIHDEYLRNNDNTWGNALISENAREVEWKHLLTTINTNPLPVCSNSCGTTLRKGQWKTEVFFS